MSAFLSLCYIAISPGAPNSPPQAALRPLPSQTHIAIDGRLDEPIWNRELAISHFKQRYPRHAEPPPVDTAFLAYFDRDDLYIGIWMDELPDQEVTAFEMRRDSFRIFADDAVSVKIDARLDQRTTLGFAINANGARLDYISLENGIIWQREYDSLWDGAAAIDSTGWTAEFRIPLNSLGLADDQAAHTIGFNISRDHRAGVGTYDWALMPLEFTPTSARFYGTLTGLKTDKSGRQRVFQPFALTRFVDTDQQFQFSAGADFSQQILDQTWFETSILTDFAQVDLDNALLNLNRFELFFPERRPFFLRGLDIFNFGLSGEAQPFFSRRIGFADSDPTLVLGGAKVYGRSGNWSYGIVDTLEREATSGRALSLGQGPVKNSAVLRMRHDVAGKSQLGFLYADRRTEKSDSFGSTIGVDGQWIKNQRLELSAFSILDLRRTEDGAEIASDRSASVQLRYRGTQWEPGFRMLWIEEDHAPTLGFVRRNNIATLSAWQYHYKNIDILGIRRFRIEPRAEVILDDDFHQRLGSRAALWSGLEWVSGWNASLSADVEEDLIFDAFSVTDAIQIVEGRYTNPSLNASLSSPGRRNPSFRISGGHAFDWYEGKQTQASISLLAALNKHLRINASINQAWLNQSGRDDISTAANALATIAANSRLYVDLIGRYTVQGEEQWTGVGRLRWIYKPGSNIFLVYRNQEVEGLREQSVVLKINRWL